MGTYIILAWRNLWRNKRRTLITVASIFFGVLFSAFMSSMQEGSYANYIKTIVNSYSGYIQVHQNGYWNDKTINHSIRYSDSLLQKVQKNPFHALSAPRLETFALASSDEITKGVMVVGIDPEYEQAITALKQKVKKGSYLAPGDKGILLGDELARFLKLGVNDTLVLLGQGYHGVNAAGKYPVRGIIKLPSPDFNKIFVYMELANAQELFSAQGLITSLVIMIDHQKNLQKSKKELLLQLDSGYEVMTWEEMNTILLKQIESDRAQGVLMKGILYMIIGFGILGTVMMMMAERRREIGVTLAVGMQKHKMALILILETVMIGMIGVLAGVIASIPLNYFFYLNPIPLTGDIAKLMSEMGFEPVMKFSMAPVVFYNQAITIFIFTLVISLYPLYHLSKLKIMNAMRA